MVKVLVVDDSGLARRTTRNILATAGHEVVEAEDGLAALERYFLEKPNLVLLDVTMREMDGLEVLKRLRELDPQAKVIIVSADVQDSTRQMAQDGGASRLRYEAGGVRAALGSGRECACRRRVMELTERQTDAITELINIAFSRGGASLSDLTKCRVELEVPQVSVHVIAEISNAVSAFVSGDVATVHQVFTGPVAGDAFLLLNFDGAVHLVDLLTGTETSGKSLGASAREVIAEVGNILMNACLGVFGNLLKVRFSFSIPRLSLNDLGEMVQSLVIEDDSLQHALVVGARFRMRGGEVTGCLIMVLGIASFGLFLKAVEDWAQSVSGDGA